MSNLPSELASFLSFFQINPSGDPESIWLTGARLHRLTIAALQPLEDPSFEELLLKEDSSITEYLTELYGGKEILSDTARLHFLMDSVQSTLSREFQFTTDSSQHVKLLYEDKVCDLFPLFLSKGDLVYWFKRCLPGIFLYGDGKGNTFKIDSNHSSFAELLEGFLDKGWYRVAPKTLECIPENRRRVYENKIYSAHCLLACELYKAKRYRDAINEFEKAMSIKSNIPQLYYNLALSYAKIKILQNCHTNFEPVESN